MTVLNLKLSLLVILLSESYQEIEATLTEMESCMRLLFPEFDLTNIQSTKIRSSNSQSANECASADEQPCCSKDLMDNRRERMIQGREEEQSNVAEVGETENNGMIADKREERKKQERSENFKRNYRDSREKQQKKEKGKQDEKGEVEKAPGGGVKEKDDNEEEEVEQIEEEMDNGDFIRSSGLISHGYSLDLDLSSGG